MKFWNRYAAPALLASLGVMLMLAVATPAVAAPTAAQKKQAAALLKRIGGAGQLFAQRKIPASAKAVREIQADFEKLSADADAGMVEALMPVYDSLKKAHGLLELQGYTMPALTKPAVGAKPDPKGTPTPKPGGDGTSFVSDVAPMLASKCGRCHITKASGGFSMATFAAMMRGTRDGAVITPGSDASRLIQVIEEGDMPRGGAKVSPAELAALKKWVTEGAKFDGLDASVSLATFGAGGGTRPMAPAIVKSTGKESVSFSRDIAPLLVTNCSGCHIGAMRPRGGLNLGTFEAIMRGGDSDSPIVPGKPGDSLLVQKLKGMGGGQRMPLNKAPLPESDIALISTWIQEGATFDGGNPREDVVKLAARTHAENATHEELSAERSDAANTYWNLSMPDIDAERIDTEHYLVMGNQKEEDLKKIADLADSIAPRLVELFDAPSDQPLVKGKTTLFVFKQRYDYTEFGNMVERRSIPRELRGHWRYNIVDAYGAMIPPRRDEYSNDALVGQQLAGVYVSTLNLPPRWFAEGAARYAASKIAPEDPRVKTWDEQLKEVKGSIAKPSEFLDGKMPAEAADIMAYGVVKFLFTDSARFKKLLSALRNKADFEEAFAGAYGGTPEQIVGVWMKRR